MVSPQPIKSLMDEHGEIDWARALPMAFAFQNIKPTDVPCMDALVGALSNAQRTLMTATSDGVVGGTYTLCPAGQVLVVVALSQVVDEVGDIRAVAGHHPLPRSDADYEAVADNVERLTRALAGAVDPNPSGRLHRMLVGCLMAIYDEAFNDEERTAAYLNLTMLAGGNALSKAPDRQALADMAAEGLAPVLVVTDVPSSDRLVSVLVSGGAELPDALADLMT